MAECWKDSSGTFAYNQIGTWGYLAGVGSFGDPALVLSGLKKILGIRMLGVTASSFSIDGGASVVLLKNEIWWDNPLGNLVDPTISWNSGSVRYFIEFVVT